MERSPECPRGALRAIRLWEDLVGVWEAGGEIVGVATIEHPDPAHRGYGEIFLQRHPAHVDLLHEMMEYGERRFVNPATGRTHIFVYEDDPDLVEVVERRGYARNVERGYSHLVVAAPDGTYAACCIVWYDEPNRIGRVEPLGTHPDHRKRGLARAVMLEGIRRLDAMGARRIPLDGAFDPFYEAIGFRKQRSCSAWEKNVRRT